MKKYITLALAIGTWIFNSNPITAQNAQNPWAVGIGANIVSIDDDNSGSGTGVPALSLTRYLGGNFSIGAQYSANSIDGSAEDYYTIDGIIKYNIVKEGKVIPYLFAGYGLSRLGNGPDKDALFPSGQSARTTLGGAGINVRLSDKWAANLSSSMRSASEKGSANQLQHVIGLTYVFGTGDADGDGIPDNEDSCPEEAGTAEMKGCPDTDGDGIADGDDACPEAAGSAEMGGCPDSDGDTVADKDDKCPDVAGETGNNGCPWPDTDGDGVLDKDDLCPNEAGVAANGGCVAEPTKLIDFISNSESKIYFGSSSVNLGKSGEELITNLKSLLDEYPDVNIVVQGHASDDGSESYNMKISQKRADTVAAALVAAGIDESRVTTEAFGETKPLSDRKSSRRVEFDRGVN